MTRRDLGMAPYRTDDMTRFLIPSLGAAAGGRVMVFKDNADRDAVAAYYRGLGRQSAAFYSHVFTADRALVQINGDLPDAKAARFGKQLKRASGAAR
jgi:hypothetical protein